MTAKGQLVRSIVFPKGFGFDFYRDAIRFVFFMSGIAILGSLYSVYLFLMRGVSCTFLINKMRDSWLKCFEYIIERFFSLNQLSNKLVIWFWSQQFFNNTIFWNFQSSLETILLRSLDIITIVVPPALPAAMTVGTIYAQRRLKKKGIFCTAPPRINVAGKVKLVCFDKVICTLFFSSHKRLTALMDI